MIKVTVWFDGSCPLCRREVALMRRLDRDAAVDFIDVGTGDGACPIDRSDLLNRFHAREAGGPMLSGAAAFGAMWRVLPLLRPLGLMARNPVILAGLERLYRVFLTLRPPTPAQRACLR
jgi:predicted DCC family thiol-disulfide oxidoreductase YuxK